MQFLAYLPDDSMSCVPFEVIPLFIDDGITTYKKAGAKNPDLIILSYNQSTNALFIAKSAMNKSEQSNAEAKEAIQIANLSMAAAEEALGKSKEAVETSGNAMEKAQAAERISAIAEGLADSAKAAASTAETLANQADENSLVAKAESEQAIETAASAVETAASAEKAALEAKAEAASAITAAGLAEEKAGDALLTAQEVDGKAAKALAAAEQSNSIAVEARTSAAEAVSTAQDAKELIEAAEEKAEQAEAVANGVDAKANEALTTAHSAEQSVVTVAQNIAEMQSKITQATNEIAVLKAKDADLTSCVAVVDEKADAADTKAEFANTTAQVAQNGLNGKVDKVNGKALSDENYTAEEKSKLAGIEVGATKYKHPDTHPASIIAQDEFNRFMSDAEKEKLSGIEAKANKYTHPETHSASMIVQDTERRFVSDAEKDKWNANKQPHSVSIIIAPYNAGSAAKAGADVILSGDETDCEKINQAIVTLVSGGCIAFLEGTVQCHSSIILNGGISILGQGRSTVFQKNFDGVMFSIVAKDCVRLQDFLLNGNTTTGYNISFNQAKKCRASNLEIVNAATGIEVDGGEFISISGCHIETSSYGIYLSQTQGLTIRNTFCSSASSGIISANNFSNSILIAESKIVGGTNALFLRRIQYGRMTSCHIETTGSVGASFQFCSFTALSNNIFKGSSAKVVMMSGGYNIFSNNITEGTINSTESTSIFINNVTATGSEG